VPKRAKFGCKQLDTRVCIGNVMATALGDFRERCAVQVAECRFNDSASVAGIYGSQRARPHRSHLDVRFHRPHHHPGLLVLYILSDLNFHADQTRALCSAQQTLLKQDDPSIRFQAESLPPVFSRPSERTRSFASPSPAAFPHASARQGATGAGSGRRRGDILA